MDDTQSPHDRTVLPSDPAQDLHSLLLEPPRYQAIHITAETTEAPCEKQVLADIPLQIQQRSSQELRLSRSK